MFRLLSRGGNGRMRRQWLGVATAAALLVAAVPAQAAPFAYVTNLEGDNVSQYDVGAGGRWRRCPRRRWAPATSRTRSR